METELEHDSALKRPTKPARKSAKDVTSAFADELLRRTQSPDVLAKLLALETIALRMGWKKLYNRLRFRSGGERPAQVPWYNRD